MEKPDEASSSDTDDWQELTQSDYAKVIFSELCHDGESGCVACKFQITDNVHEDPSDYLGVFRVGYEDISQCIAWKMLSETDCEEDGKLMRCQFRYDELPPMEDGFYQFLYITRDKEVCGASMPFEIKQPLNNEEIIAENMDGDFLIVKRGLEKKNEELITRVQKYEHLNQMLMTDMKKLIAQKGNLYQEKEAVISNLKQDCLKMKKQLMKVKRDLKVQENSVQESNQQLQLSKAANLNLCNVNASLRKESADFSGKIRDLECLLKEKESTISELTYGMETDKKMLFEQIEEFKCMVKALEDSKQLAVKEMKDLSDNLHWLKAKNEELVAKHDELENRYVQVVDELKRLKEHNEGMRDFENPEYREKLEEATKRASEMKDDLNFVKCKYLAYQVSSEVNLKDIEEKQSIQIENFKKLLADKETENLQLQKMTSMVISMEKNKAIAKESETTARLTEAAELYKKQFKEIEQLKKKVNKLKHSKKNMELKYGQNKLSELGQWTFNVKNIQKASELAASSTQPTLTTSGAASSTQPTLIIKDAASLTQPFVIRNDTAFFKVIRPSKVDRQFFKNIRKNPDVGWNLKNIGFLDVVKDAAQAKSEDSLIIDLSACSSSSLEKSEVSKSDSISESSGKITPVTSECSDCDTGEHVVKDKDANSLTAEKIVAVTDPTPALSHHLEKKIQQDSIVVNKNSAATQTPAELVDLPCSLCSDKIEVCAGESSETLRLHYELKHDMQMCPVCGQLFESSFPEKYLVAHVNCHFKD